MTSGPKIIDTICPDCGARIDGGRAGCQALFDEVLAREFSDYTYAREHRLTVDVYSLQHPSKYMQSAKSYAAHLTGIYAALESDFALETNRTIQQWLSSSPKGLKRPDDPPPQQRGALTIIHVHEAMNPDEHLRRVREWAESAWVAWSDYQEFAKQWISMATGKH